MVGLEQQILKMCLQGAKTWSFISAKARLLPDIYGTGVEPFATTAASTLQ
jgi:hypothetical protein